MHWSFTDTSPIFIQIAQLLEEDIFSGLYREEEQIPSTTEVSVSYRLNPATVLKGYNILVDKDYIYKRRGIGMFVKEGALERIREERRQRFRKDFLVPFMAEAKRLGLTEEDLRDMISEREDS